MQKHVNLVDLVKSFPTNIYLQNLASIQKRTSPVKFAHLAEKSGKGSISNLSTKVLTFDEGLAFCLTEPSWCLLSGRLRDPLTGEVDVCEEDVVRSHCDRQRGEYFCSTLS